MVATVLTSENLAEFHAQRIEASAPPAVAEKSEPEKAKTPDVTDVVDKNEAEPQENPETDPPEKPPKVDKVQIRIDKAVKEREDARREAASERSQREAAEAKTRELEARLNPPAKVIPEGKPRPEQFKDAFEYAEALAEWSTDEALDKRDRQEAEKKQIAERAKVINQWNDRQDAAKTALEDYADVIESSTVQVSDQVRDAILESDAGPQILYHLAKNPEIAEALAGKSVSSALREIGKLEAKLSASEPKEAKPVVTPSKASPPITPIRGTKTIDSPMGADGEFHGTFAQWKAARRAGKIK